MRLPWMLLLQHGAGYLHVFVGWRWGVVWNFRRVEGGTPVLGNILDINGSERCTIIDLIPTGSYQPTLSWIVFSYVVVELKLYPHRD